jgi:hypothetical protein
MDACTGSVPTAKVTDLPRRLIEGVRRDQIRLCGMGSHHGGDTLRLAAGLREEDDRLDPTDSLVAASALACEDCKRLYTNDPKLLRSKPLLLLAREKGLAVLEAPG